LRASSFASLEPLDPENDESSQISLKLPVRPRRRLAITLRLPNQPVERFSPWERCSNLKETDSRLPFAEDLELARAEVLDEEIFGEVSTFAFFLILSNTRVRCKKKRLSSRGRELFRFLGMPNRLLLIEHRLQIAQ
jgi:hypothetical protein